MDRHPYLTFFGTDAMRDPLSYSVHLFRCEHLGQETKGGLRVYALASMDALRIWVFWTWKIGQVLKETTMAPL
jgi:hypothetical protein